MEYKFRCYLINSSKMKKNIEKSKKLNEIIEDNNENKSNYILMQSTGIKDRYRNSVFSGDYILYDSGFTRNFLKVTETPLGFCFCSWDWNKKRWRYSTYNGIEIYGEIIGNIYEGIKLKKIYKEMKELGIFKEEE